VETQLDKLLGTNDVSMIVDVAYRVGEGSGAARLIPAGRVLMSLTLFTHAQENNYEELKFFKVIQSENNADKNSLYAALRSFMAIYYAYLFPAQRRTLLSSRFPRTKEPKPHKPYPLPHACTNHHHNKNLSPYTY